MRIEEYEKMYHLENYYWWFQGRMDIIFSVLRKYHVLEQSSTVVLDAGCGTGLILKRLNSHCRPLGVDFSLKALEYCRKRGLNNYVRGDVTRLPLNERSCDVVMGLDLLEHVEDDNVLMEEFSRVLKDDGTLVLTVPAHRFLWSEHDEALSHFRRYSRQSFGNLITTHGFAPLKLTYAISFTYIPIILFRKLQPLLKKRTAPKTHLIRLPGLINSALIGLLKMEAFLLKFMNLPFGVSLLCVARKKK